MTEPIGAVERAETSPARVSYVIARLERAVRGAIGALSNAQLARRSYMTPQSMSEVIEALETKGLIERKQHPNHRRVLPAELTATGRKVLEACEEAVAAMEEEMLRDLGPEERETFYHGLVSSVRALHAGFPEH
jgi:DNA-binding MarR family transcriptional regulator